MKTARLSGPSTTLIVTIVLFLVDFEAPGEEIAENVALIDELPLFSMMMAQHPMEVELARSGMRVRRGVSDECCHKGCSLAVLSSYCAE